METYSEYLERLEEEKRIFIFNFPQTKTFTTRKHKTITRKLYSFEADYPSPKTKQSIFKHGKTGYTIWFLNKKKKVCAVDKAIQVGDTICLAVTVDVYKDRKKTCMTLDRFLSLVESGDFKITLKKFVDIYLKPITESNYYKKKLKEFDDRFEEAKKINS